LASSSISEREGEASKSVKDLRAVLGEKSRQTAIQVGIRDVRTYVDPYILARRAVTFFKTMLAHAEELVRDNLDNLNKMLSSLADELAASAPSISPAFVIASILQVLYDELTETEADINLIWRAMSKVSDTGFVRYVYVIPRDVARYMKGIVKKVVKAGLTEYL